MESGIEEKSGGGVAVENSRKQRSLDLQTLYKSGDLKKGIFFAEKSDSGGARKNKNNKKRKSIKEVSLEKLEPSEKKSKCSVDEDQVNGATAGSVESRVLSGLSGFSLNLDSNGNAIRIPKRPRGTVGRKKFDRSRVSQSLTVQATINGNVKLEVTAEKIEGDQLPKLSVLSGVEASNNDQTAKSPDDSAGNKRKVSADESRGSKKDRASPIRHVKVDGHAAVNNGEASHRKNWSARSKRKDATYRSRNRVKNGVPSGHNSSRSRNPEKTGVPSGDNLGSSSRSRNPVKSGVPCGGNLGSLCQDSLDDDDEENLEENAARMLSSRFDPSCTGFSSKSRSSASLSADRLSSLLSSGQDFISREGNALADSESASADTANRVLRPRKKLKEKGTSRKRRHFYEVLPRDLDAYWALNRRIKVFWPLDESWYYGLLNDYDPESKLHHVKYDDRDEEWINLKTERFKLLLLPGEVPGKTKTRKRANVEKNIDEGKLDLAMDDDSNTGNCLDSEPIISWLARSSRRVKSSPSRPLKKQRMIQLSPSIVSSTSHDRTEGSKWNIGSLDGDESKPDFDSLFPDNLINVGMTEKSVSESQSSPKDRIPVVYVRRRFRKKAKGLSPVYEDDKAYATEMTTISAAPVVDGLQNHNTHIMSFPSSESESLLPAIDDEGVQRLDMSALDFKQFRVEIRLPVLPLLRIEAEHFWLYRIVLQLQHGAITIRWPKVVLEILFVDNTVGLRFLLFECCLNQAVAFIFLVLTLFSQADEEWKFDSLQLPVTSVRLCLSAIQDVRRQELFSFYCFSKLKHSKWLYLDSKLQRHSLLARHLPLEECTYENIKSFECRSDQLQFSAHAKPSSYKRKFAPSCLLTGISTDRCSARMSHSTFGSAVKLGKVRPFALSFTAAPTFFISLHLRLLMERNFACLSLREYDYENACQPVKDDSSKVNYSENVVEMSAGIAESLFTATSAGGLQCAEKQLGISVREQYSDKDTSDVLVVLNKSVSDDHESDQFVASPEPKCADKIISHSLANARCHAGLVGMSVEIPPINQVEGQADGKGLILGQSSDLALNTSDGMIHSPNLTVTSNGGQSPNITGSRGLIYRNRNNSCTSPFGEISPVWVDGKTNFMRSGFGNGPKKPRTQVQYTLPYGGYDFGSLPKNHSPRTLPYKRARRASAKRIADSCRGSQRNIELLACDANVLVTLGDKGWRVSGARVVLEVADHNEWRIAVKLSGVTKYSYKVRNVLQPGSTNRFTHAMMWKGGKDWVLEFPDRSQWMLFKEMHEECYNRNIRAASVKNIPIPGVRLIEEIEDYASSDAPFVRCSPKYFRQVECDIDMAMNPSRILYDMDSEDERWLSKKKISFSNESRCEEISEELFEKTMDMFEKVAYAQQCDQFTLDELEELMVGVGSMQVVKSIYEHWQQKRQRKGMPLIRHLQTPLWERYQQQLKDWEQTMSKASPTCASICQEKATAIEKPPVFAFCLKPRGLEVPNKGSKQRSQRKISVSGHNHAVSRDQDGLHQFGRRSNGYAHADEMVVYQGSSHEYSDSSPVLRASPGVFSPREASGIGYFSLNSDVSEWNHQPKFYRNKSKKIGSFQSLSNPRMVASYDQRTIVKRNGVHRWNMGLPEWPSQKHYHPEASRGLRIEQFDSSDLQEFRLRDASGAAQHALNMAKLKREKAQRLLYRADLAIHKAVVALMTAEAIKAAAESTNADG